MKFLYWCVGVMQIVTGYMLAWSIAPAWRAVWVSASVIWVFVGVVFALLGVARMMSSKVGPGAVSRFARSVQQAPGPTKGE